MYQAPYIPQAWHSKSHLVRLLQPLLGPATSAPRCIWWRTQSQSISSFLNTYLFVSCLSVVPFVYLIAASFRFYKLCFASPPFHPSTHHQHCKHHHISSSLLQLPTTLNKSSCYASYKAASRYTAKMNKLTTTSDDSTVAQSFSDELMGIFRIDNSLSDLDHQVDERLDSPTLATRISFSQTNVQFFLGEQPSTETPRNWLLSRPVCVKWKNAYRRTLVLAQSSPSPPRLPPSTASSTPTALLHLLPRMLPRAARELPELHTKRLVLVICPLHPGPVKVNTILSPRPTSTTHLADPWLLFPSRWRPRINLDRFLGFYSKALQSDAHTLQILPQTAPLLFMVYTIDKLPNFTISAASKQPVFFFFYIASIRPLAPR